LFFFDKGVNIKNIYEVKIGKKQSYFLT